MFNTRKVKEQDVYLLQSISRRTFLETFTAQNKMENLLSYMKWAFSRKQLLMEIRNQFSEFYFLMEGRKVIGYIKLNYLSAQTEKNQKDSLEIERLYVQQKFLGSGGGPLLMQLAVLQAKRKKLKYIWLGVWEFNERAKRFYEKQGFEIFGKHLFRLGDEDQYDLLVKRKIER